MSIGLAEVDRAVCDQDEEPAKSDGEKADEEAHGSAVGLLPVLNLCNLSSASNHKQNDDEWGNEDDVIEDKQEECGHVEVLGEDGDDRKVRGASAGKFDRGHKESKKGNARNRGALGECFDLMTEVNRDRERGPASVPVVVLEFQDSCANEDDGNCNRKILRYPERDGSEKVGESQSGKEVCAKDRSDVD